MTADPSFSGQSMRLLSDELGAGLGGDDMKYLLEREAMLLGETAAILVLRGDADYFSMKALHLYRHPSQAGIYLDYLPRGVVA